MLITSCFDTLISQFSDIIIYQPLPSLIFKNSSARLPLDSPSPFYHKSHILSTHFPKKAEASVISTDVLSYSLISRAEIMCVLCVCSNRTYFNMRRIPAAGCYLMTKVDLGPPVTFLLCQPDDTLGRRRLVLINTFLSHIHWACAL